MLSKYVKSCRMNVLAALLLGTVATSVFMVPVTSVYGDPIYVGGPPIVWMLSNPPEYWGIFIGVNDTKPLKSPWPSAIGMKNKLDGYPGYSETRKRLHLSGMKSTHPEYPGNASWQEIKDSIQWVYDNADDCDIVVFYFAGHGFGFEDNGEDEGIFVGEDGSEEVTDDMLYDEFEKFEDKPMVGLILIFDCCHSGGMVDGAGDLQNIENPHAILMACRHDECAHGIPFDGWLFIYTHYLLEGLDGADGTTRADKKNGNNDKTTTPLELHMYASPRTTVEALGIEEQQHPRKEPSVVGGIRVSVNKLALLAPYIALAVAAVAVTIGAVSARKRWSGKAAVPKP